MAVQTKGDTIQPAMQQLASSPFYEDIICGYDKVFSNRGSIAQFNLSINGQKQKQWTSICTVPVGFFKLFNCQLLEGRFFDEDSDPNDIVVDKTFADMFPSESIVEKIIDKYHIVGVINTNVIQTNMRQLMDH